MDSITKKIKYKYVICEFNNFCNKDGKTDIDIVPTSWVKYNFTAKVCEIKYPNPPYSKKDFQQLHARVQANLPPLPHWPAWSVTIKGGADTYEKAEERILKLKNATSYAFTTDVDNDDEEKAKTINTIFCEEDLQSILSIPENRAENSSDSTPNSSSDSSLIEKKTVQKKKDYIDQATTSATTIPEDENLENLNIINIGSLKPLKNKLKLNRNVSFPCSKNDANITSNLSTDIKALLRAVALIKLTIEETNQDVRELKKKLIGSSNNSLENILIKYKITLPITSLENWYIFNTHLKEDEKLKDSFIIYIKYNIDKAGNNAVKSIKNNLEKLLTKELISNFTALKKANKAVVFKEFESYSILKSVVTNAHRDANGDILSEGFFHAALSSAFANAKDWGGRVKKLC